MFFSNVHEKFSLFNCIVCGNVSVRRFGKPSLGHILFGTFSKWHFENSADETLDVEGGKRKWRSAHKMNEIPVEKSEIKTGGKTNANWSSWQTLYPLHEIFHHHFGILKILT